MKNSVAILVIIMALAFSARVPATDTGLLDPDNLSNHANLSLVGDTNKLVIVQTLGSGTSANRIFATIDGNRNGGPYGSAFSSAAATSGLTPGELIQNGSGNLIQVHITGNDNHFAFTQLGNNNDINASVAGAANEAAVQQFGNGNFAYFTQIGVGNSVKITQTAR